VEVRRACNKCLGRVWSRRLVLEEEHGEGVYSGYGGRAWNRCLVVQEEHGAGVYSGVGGRARNRCLVVEEVQEHGAVSCSARGSCHQWR